VRLNKIFAPLQASCKKKRIRRRKGKKEPDCRDGKHSIGIKIKWSNESIWEDKKQVVFFPD
jgi:hypothetical protein